MQNFKEHIILKLAVIFLTAILVFPSIVKLSHSFENHKHEACNGEKQTHIHTKDIDCSLCDFNTTNFNYDIVKYPEFYKIIHPSKPLNTFLASFITLSDTHPKQLRAPPPFYII